ncbi:MAG: hypothetical protein Q4F83_03355 [Eubacteriales bacterium]|nr:hypothetical protein [Eubacteriales bacterium]
MKKVAKGNFGYIRDQKKRRIIITIIMFSIPLVIYFTGLLQTHTRKNLFTLVAILGCLPASKSAVGMILICLQKPMEKVLYDKILPHVRDLTVIYDTVVSAYEKNTQLPCIVISGLNVICYCEDTKVNSSFVESHIKKILQSNGYKANVKIFTDLNHFLRRVDELYAHREELEKDVPFTPDERYPDATRNELVKAVLLAISV